MPPHTTALLILTHGDAADPILSAVQQPFEDSDGADYCSADCQQLDWPQCGCSEKTALLRVMLEIGELCYRVRAEIARGNSGSRRRFAQDFAESDNDLDPVDRLSFEDVLARNDELRAALARSEAAELQIWEAKDEKRRIIEEMTTDFRKRATRRPAEREGPRPAPRSWWPPTGQNWA